MLVSYNDHPQRYPLSLCSRCGTLSILLDPGALHVYNSIKENGGVYKTTTKQDLFGFDQNSADNASEELEDKIRKIRKNEGDYIDYLDTCYDGKDVRKNYFEFVFDHRVAKSRCTNYTNSRGQGYFYYSSECSLTAHEEIRLKKEVESLPTAAAFPIKGLYDDNPVSGKCPCCGGGICMGWTPVFELKKHTPAKSDAIITKERQLVFKEIFGDELGSSIIQEYMPLPQYAGEKHKQYVDGLIKQYGSEFLLKVAKYDWIMLKLETEYDPNYRSPAKKEANEFISACENIEITPISITRKPEMKEFISQYIAIEKNIEFFSKRIVDLYEKRRIAKELYDGTCLITEHENRIKREKIQLEQKKLAEDREQEIKYLSKKIYDLLNNVPDSLIIEKHYNFFKPKMPTSSVMQQPREPIYLKPGFFNKKRILAENEALRNEYDSQLAKYNSYKEALAKYHVEISEYDKLINQKRIELKNEWIQEAQELQEKLERLQNEPIPQIAEEGGVSDSSKVPDNFGYHFLENECKECEKTLRDFFDARKQLEALDVIFPKYLNFVAMATISEYLTVGRCTELTGPDGAYNLYETELRQNIIISKLDTIIEKLEEIKQNQFTLYRILNAVNKNLASLNGKMDVAVSSLRSIDSTVQDVRELSAVTAYNTEKTAIYAKANAELTDSLGFMLALK